MVQIIFDFPNPNPILVNCLPTGQLGIFVPAPSSKEYKHNIKNMDVDSEIIYQLRPVTFDYNDTSKTGYGLIAEEVDEIFPYLVMPHPTTQKRVYSVDYPLLTPLLLNEVQKINNRVITLEEKDLIIDDLKMDNQKMKEIITNLLNRIQKLEKYIS